MLHTDVRHKSTYVSYSTIISLLRQGVLLNIIARRFLAAWLPMQALASSSARSSLITAHSCFASRSQALALQVEQPGELGVRGIHYHDSTIYVRDTVVFVQHIWQPKQQQPQLQLLQRP